MTITNPIVSYAAIMVDQSRKVSVTFRLWVVVVFMCVVPAQAASTSAEAVWGPVVAGLRAGLVPPSPTTASTSAKGDSGTVRGNEAVEFTVILENAGKTALRLPGSILLAWHWRITLTPMTGGQALRAVLHPPPIPLSPISPLDLPPGARQHVSIPCGHWIAVGEEETYDKISAVLPNGSYRSSGSYELPQWEKGLGLWAGEIVTGEAKVRIFSD